MFKKVLKITGIVLGSIVALFMIAYVAIYAHMRVRIAQVYDEVVPEKIQVLYDSASIALGRRLVATRACNDCHGADFGGRIIYDDFMIGRVSSRNITHGKGGLPDDYSVEDWVMALKHGLDRDKKALKFMPSNEFCQMSEPDIASIIAFMSTVPNVDRQDLPVKVGPLGYTLSEFNVIPLLAAEKVDHAIPFAQHIQAGPTVEYGKYVSMVCTNCHGINLKGQPPMVPGGSPIPDLTKRAGEWSHEEFITTLQSGIRPDDSKLSDEMPWQITTSFTKEELTALHLYIQSLK